jgi:hypothetical protein
MRLLSQPSPGTVDGGEAGLQPPTQFEAALDRLRPLWELQGRLTALTREKESLLTPAEVPQVCGPTGGWAGAQGATRSLGGTSQKRAMTF